MITAFVWTTPNSYGLAIALAEMALEYRLKRINAGQGAQLAPDCPKLSPNGRVPAIMDHDTGVRLTGAGAILQYLAEKTGTFGGGNLESQAGVTQWLHWQMGSLAPIMRQANHFRGLREKVPFGEALYMDEVVRLFGVLDQQLEGRDYIAEDYSIADIAALPWVGMAPMMGDDRLTAHTNVMSWIKRSLVRPPTAKAITMVPR